MEVEAEREKYRCGVCGMVVGIKPQKTMGYSHVPVGGGGGGCWGECEGWGCGYEANCGRKCRIFNCCGEYVVACDRGWA